MRALLYLRQSDSAGAGAESLSLESQSAVLRADAQRLDWTIVGEIRDADEKGWDDRRPGLTELYRRCETGDVDLVAVWSVSRLARSVRILETVAHELERIGVTLYSHEEPHAGQPLYRQILGAVAEQDTRDKAAHVQRAVRAKMARGNWHGTVPYGYRQPDPKGRLVPDEDTAPLVRDIYERRAAGIGPAAIALDLTRRGIPTPRQYPAWHTATIANILRHVAHRGAVRAGDAVIEGTHEPIVDADLWQRAQMPSAGRRWPRVKTITSWLDGLTEHICGQPMYLCQPSSYPHAALRCRDAGRGWRHAGSDACPYSPRLVRLDRIEPLAWEAVVVALEAILEPAAVLAAAQERYRRDTPAADAARSEALQRQKRATVRRSRAESLYLSGRRGRAWFDVEDALASAELEECGRVLSALPAPPNSKAITATWNDMRKLRDAAEDYDDQARAGVLRALGVIVVGPSGTKAPGKGGPDQGRVVLRVKPELADYFSGTSRASLPCWP